MPFVGLGLHVLIALCFAVHAVRSGQDKYWLWILFAFPGLGSLVYALAIWLPDQLASYRGQRVVHGVRRFLDPSRELRAAQEQLEIAATAENRLRLAEALLASGQASAAVAQFQAVLEGVHADDANLRVRYATALLEAGQAAAARSVLEALIREQPNFKSADGHLVFARALAALDERAKAKEEFEVLASYFAGLEARARYAEILLGWGERGRAAELVADSLRQAKRMPRYARDINKPWLASLQRSEAALKARAAQ